MSDKLPEHVVIVDTRNEELPPSIATRFKRENFNGVVAIIGSNHADNLSALARLIATNRPDVGLIIVEELIEQQPIASPKDSLSKVRIELTPLKVSSTTEYVDSSAFKPWKTRHKNNYKSKRKR